MVNLDKNHATDQEVLGYDSEEKVIPWAEGNGLWGVITKLVSNLIGVDLVTFFVRNPYTFDSAEGLAVRIGRDEEKVRLMLEELEEAGFLMAMDLGGARVYELTDEPHRRQTLQQYVTWLQEGYHWARMVMDDDL